MEVKGSVWIMTVMVYSVHYYKCDCFLIVPCYSYSLSLHLKQVTLHDSQIDDFSMEGN